MYHLSFNIELSKDPAPKLIPQLSVQDPNTCVEGRKLGEIQNPIPVPGLPSVDLMKWLHPVFPLWGMSSSLSRQETCVSFPQSLSQVWDVSFL